MLSEHPFGLLPDEIISRQDSPLLWVLYEHRGCRNDWGSESDIQGMVKNVLESAIYTIGLQGVIKCFNELSIFDLRPDIWIVCQGGAPIGVVEVKKPDENDTLRHAAVQGQLFDYMLRLQSFFGLKHVFGILTSYEHWRICWMPQTDQAAESSSISIEAEEKYERVQAVRVVPERKLHGSQVLRWDDAELPRILCSTILKMHNSPISQVRLIDENRPYIIMDETQWAWGKIAVKDESSLVHSKLPMANKFTLLADLREGADGRVWRACTDSGKGCCIKFPMRTQAGRDEVSEEEQLSQIEQEERNWHKAYGKESARMVTLAGRPALVMRYLRPLDLVDGRLSAEDETAVKTAIEKFASKGMRHEDLALRHIGLLSPPKKSRGKRVDESEIETEVVLFDLGRVSKGVDPTLALADMLSQVNLA